MTNMVSIDASDSLNNNYLLENTNCDVVIIGAGIAGLSCATEIYKTNNNINLMILEASDSPGGRIKTDKIDGYLLDRGFQVFIEKYPEALNILDYDELNLKSFLPGAMVRYDNKLWKVSDPFRRPQDIIASVFTPIGSLIDKIRIGIFSILIQLVTIETIFSRSEYDTLDYLINEQKLSSLMIDRFFAPFYQGIFLSPLQYQNSRMFEFVFKMFTEGAATLPANGMQEICSQLANKLPSNSCLYNTKVTSLKSKSVSILNDQGNEINIICDKIIVATDPNMAKKLLNENNDDSNSNNKNIDIPLARKSTCLYYGFKGLPPIEDPMLILNGDNSLTQNKNWESSTTINNICFPSQVSSSYAPDGYSLASITIVGAAEGVSDDDLQINVRQQLKEWFPTESIDEWKFLKSYRINYAQPAQTKPYDINGRTETLGNDIYICGDHRGTATLNGAIESGRRAAKAILK